MSHRPYHVNLALLLAECDANYARLMMLMPGLRSDDAAAAHVRDLLVGTRDGEVPVRLEEVERCRYTTTVRIVQGLPSLGERLEFDLDCASLTVRLYHDARSAEVIGFQNHRRFAPVNSYPNRAMLQRDEKAQVNGFLSELLAHCINHGALPTESVSIGAG